MLYFSSGGSYIDTVAGRGPARETRTTPMRPYGQKRVYGHYITRSERRIPGGKIHVETGVKSRKAGRRVDPAELVVDAADAAAASADYALDLVEVEEAADLAEYRRPERLGRCHCCKPAEVTTSPYAPGQTLEAALAAIGRDEALSAAHPHRVVFGLTEDLDHWRNCGITTGDQLWAYLDAVAEREARKAAMYGYD